MATATTTELKKHSFKVADGKSALLLLPADSGERGLVEDALLDAGYTIDDLPKIAKDYELRTHKLGTKHVIFTAVSIPTAIGLKKRPEKYKLVISPPIDCGKFASTSDDDEFGEVNAAALVDTIQKYVLPLVVKLSQEGFVRIMGQ